MKNGVSSKLTTTQQCRLSRVRCEVCSRSEPHARHGVAPRAARRLHRSELVQLLGGSVLVRARFASICGSDLEYFNSRVPMGRRTPDSFWDRDGYCGHEVVGTVIASKSERFRPGDTALALPTSYFKSTRREAAGYGYQDWYREELHGVLMEPFPLSQTRGGFAEVYTSHEIYCYKIGALTREMVTAQGLGCVLRMARKLGWSIDGSPDSRVRGKSVAIIGQGQNGLIAARKLPRYRWHLGCILLMYYRCGQG